MRMRIKLIPFLIIIAMIVGSAQGKKITKTGTTAAKFLTIGVGSRANGMGDAFVAIANDGTAMYWNPAGIAQLTSREVVANYSKWIADMDFSYSGVVIPFGGNGVLGFNATYMLMINEMEVTTEEYPEGTGETFSAGGYALGISYARNLTDRFAIGANLKYVGEYIMNSGAASVALDIGTLFTTPFRDIRLGVSISNFGSKMQITGDDLLVQKDIDERIYGNNESVNAYLATDQFDLPLLLRVGLSGDIISSNLLKITWAMDAAHPNDNTEYMNYGLEAELMNGMVVLRGGLKSMFLKDRDENLSLGGGVNFKLSDNMRLKVDYSYQSFSHLQDAHKYTLRLMF